MLRFSLRGVLKVLKAFFSIYNVSNTFFRDLFLINTNDEKTNCNSFQKNLTYVFIVQNGFFSKNLKSFFLDDLISRSITWGYIGLQRVTGP